MGTIVVTFKNQEHTSLLSTRNYTYQLLKAFILFVLVSFLSFSSSGQFLKNGKGQIILGIDFFSPLTITSNKIESITVEYSTKKPLQPIQKSYFNSNFYSFDLQGRIKQYYTTQKLFNGSIDTTVEWRFYKNGRISTKKRTLSNAIKVKSYFYENNQLSVIVHGKSRSSGNSKTILDISSYSEESAEYWTYAVLANQDTLIKKKSVNGVVFQEVLISNPDSNTKKIETSYRYAPKNNHSVTLFYSNNLLKKIEIKNSTITREFYSFSYNHDKELLSYIKYDQTGKVAIEFAEFIYEDTTGNLQAIITKDYTTNNIEIKKFCYTYY